MISVVIPLPDDRGHLAECLQGFTQQQITVPYEIIVPTSEPVSVELLEQYPDVRWLYRPGLRINALYNAGAAEARGKYLYISESHCVPQADCLHQIFNYVRQANVAAACSASGGLPGNFVSDGEQRMFEEDFLRWLSARKCKVSIRGTMIERALWEQVGGFQAEYGHFSEVMIGCKFEALGVRFGFADKSFIHHGNQVCLRELAKELQEYGEDECRCSHLAAPDEQPTASWEWEQKEKLLNRFGRLQREQWLEWARQQIRALALNYIPMSSQQSYDYFLHYWRGAIRTGRLNYLASLQSQDQATVPTLVIDKPLAVSQAA